MTARRGWRLALVGATGAVGEEVLRVLEERHTPVLELRPFASEASEGRAIDFQGEAVPVRRVDPARVSDCDLLICAAPGVLDDLREGLRADGVRVVDASGALELDLDVPIWDAGEPSPSGTEIAIPRGIVAGLGYALAPLHAAFGLERVTVTTLESVTGAGRRGAGELSVQTVQLLNAMTGETDEPCVFPQPIAFDCLPLVGEVLGPEGDTSEERRLAHVLRRLLGAPGIIVEANRSRVPVFGGSLAWLNVSLAQPAGPERLRDAWAKVDRLDLVERGLPTPRSAVGRDGIQIGRLRASPDGSRSVGFVLAMDELRRGAAVAAVEAAELLMRG